MKKAVIYVHGKGGSSSEASQYAKNCPGFDIIGVDYSEYLPQPAAERIREVYETVSAEYDTVYLLANSIGAYFSMLALSGCRIDRALFISPILDMEKLITDMMGWAGVSENVLMKKGEINTDFGETLSWEYLIYVRNHPVCWDVPTEILFAGGDNMTSRKTVDEFVRAHDAGLCVMEDGEHWFHTEKQLAFLDKWMKENM